MEEVSKKAIKQRFLALSDELMKRNNIKRDKVFAESIGLTGNQWSSIKVSEDKYATTEMIASTLKAYRNVNSEWIMTGQGQMFKNEPAVQAEPEVAANSFQSESYWREMAMKLQKIVEDQSLTIRAMSERLVGKLKGVLRSALEAPQFLLQAQSF
jgi:hypothetical protein